uniref:Putative mucin 2 length n=1 Tax=Rhodnius prolixus TaxID=13249 RepID=R4G4Y0_RHOPR
MSGFYKMIALLFAVYLISPTLAANLGITPFPVLKAQHELQDPFVRDEKNSEAEVDPFVREDPLPVQLLNPYVGNEKNPLPVQLLNPYVGDETSEPEVDPFVREDPLPVQLLNPYVGNEKTPLPVQLLNPYVGDEKTPEPEVDPFVREDPLPVQLLNPYVGDEVYGKVFKQEEEYNPLDHYPYVVDPYDGFGPSSQEGHKEHPRNPEDQYDKITRLYVNLF